MPQNTEPDKCEGWEWVSFQPRLPLPPAWSAVAEWRGPRRGCSLLASHPQPTPTTHPPSARQVEYGEIAARCQPLFLPLAKLLDSPYRPGR